MQKIGILHLPETIPIIIKTASMTEPRALNYGQQGFTKGDIIDGRKTYHPVIFIERVDADQFIGCVLTSSPTNDYPDNIGFRPEHFHQRDESGNDYKRQYKASYFVGLKFIKKNNWGPFKLTGKLTASGVSHLSQYIAGKTPVLWEDYIAK